MAGLDLSKYPRKGAVNAALPKRIGTPSEDSVFSLLNKDISFGLNPLSDKVKERFYAELSVLLEAGLDIKASLELMESQFRKSKVRQIIREINNQVVAGRNMSETMRDLASFTAYEHFSIKIGEETGQVSVVMRDLASFYANKIKQRRQMMQALSYPVIVLFTSFGAVGFMVSFIVPMFSDIFKRFGGELPYITKLIISFSEFLRTNILLLLLLSGVNIACILFFRKKEWFRKYSSKMLLLVPVLGGVVARVFLARFCSSFGLLLGSKVPLIQAINLVREMISYYPIQCTLAQVEKDILQGMALHKSLSKFDIYDQRLLALIKVGEETNKMEFFFLKLASQYNAEVDHKTAVLSSLLEPLIIIFLGLIVGVILIAMYLPLFQLSTNIG